MARRGAARRDALNVDAALVRRLLAEQFPAWAHLPVARVAHDGHDHRTFRVGDALTARLPSAERYAAKVAKEAACLPLLAPHLPLAIPETVALGAPSDVYPWPWAVRRWIEGEPASVAPPDDAVAFAAALGEFLAALQRVGTEGGLAPGAHNFHRGGALAVYDAQTRAALAALGARIDGARAAAVWDAALAAEFAGAPVWLHGDVAPSNLLVRDGRLAAVIDFGGCAVGDPSCDLAIAWTTFSGASRAAFLAALAPDAALLARARGWALWKALIVVSGHCDGDVPAERRTLAAVLAR